MGQGGNDAKVGSGSKDVADLLRWLPGIPLFGGLEEGTLRRLIELIGVQSFPPGAEVCQEGDTGRSMFIVREGEVVVCHEGNLGKRVKMMRLGPGEFFGEMTLIDIQKRSATVLVEKPSVLYSLSNKDLYALYNEDVHGYVMVIQNLARELSRRLRVTSARLQAMAELVDDATDHTLIHRAIPKRH